MSQLANGEEVGDAECKTLLGNEEENMNERSSEDLAAAHAGLQLARLAMALSERLILAAQKREGTLPEGERATRLRGSKHPGYLTIREFLKLTGISYTTYCNLRRDRKTPKEIRLTQRTILISEDAVRAWQVEMADQLPGGSAAA